MSYKAVKHLKVFLWKFIMKILTYLLKEKNWKILLMTCFAGKRINSLANSGYNEGNFADIALGSRMISENHKSN